MNPVRSGLVVPPSMAPGIWQQLRHLFESDDGSLPDVFVEGLTPQQVASIYTWLTGCSAIPLHPVVWQIEAQCEIPLAGIIDPVQELLAGRIEPFRHCLEGLTIDGVLLPMLAILVEKSALTFDYRMGPEWNEVTLMGLFGLLFRIRQFAPDAVIWRAEEGGYARPTPEFSAVFAACLATNAR